MVAVIGLVAIGGLFAAWLAIIGYDLAMMRLARSMTKEVFDGPRDVTDTSRITWECRWGCSETELQDIVHDLPKLVKVECPQSLRPLGGCCIAEFEGGVHSEIHAFWQLRGYKIQLYSYPTCNNPDFNLHAKPGSPERKQFVRCDERWRGV